MASETKAYEQNKFMATGVYTYTLPLRPLYHYYSILEKQSKLNLDTCMLQWGCFKEERGTIQAILWSSYADIPERFKGRNFV